MAFPNSPTNGQSTTVDGINYTYSSAENSWTRQTLVLTTDATASPNTVILQGVDVTQNTRISVLEGVNTTQNTNITTVTGLAQAAFDKANTGVSTSTDDYARTLANTATNNITILQGVNTTQNTRISSTDNTATAAYAKANAAFDKANTGGSGSSSGYLANSVIFANSTGYLTNTSSIQFFTSNNNLVLTGNIIAGGVRSTSSGSTPPSSPTVGDIWYDTSTDIMYRYTYDGTNSNWLDITSPTITSNASSTSTTTSTNIIISTISITDNSYAILDDTAVSNSGGYIQIAGTNFSSNCSVIIGSNNTISTTVVNSSIIRAQVGAALPTSYHVYITDSGTGAVGIKPNGLTYSSFPVWTTAATISPNGVSNVAFQLSLTANADSSITYSNTSALPANTTLLANGYFYGTISAPSSTMYNFDVKATDAELQNTSRTFSYTVAPSFPYSALFVASSSQQLYINDDSRLYFPNNDWTFEWFMRPASTAFSVMYQKRQLNQPGGDQYIQVYANYPSAGNISWAMGTGGSVTAYGNKIPLNTWRHIAVVRSSGTLSMYVDGVRESTTSISGLQNGGTGPLRIGNGPDPTNYYYDGYISNVRYNNTTAVYTGATLTVPTSQLTAIAGTVLLTCQDATFIDNSTSGFTINNSNGVTTTSSVTPF